MFRTPSPHLPPTSACHSFPPGSDDFMDEEEEEQYDLYDYLREGGGLLIGFSSPPSGDGPRRTSLQKVSIRLFFLLFCREG
jgi:hypothetical protein